VSVSVGRPVDVDVRLLGPLEVRRRGRVIAVPGGRARSLLTVLALQVGEAIIADRLIDALWGDVAPATAKTVLQGFVSKLRKALGAAAVETTGTSYRLAVPANAIDINRFHELVGAARELEGDERSATLEQALALWRGPALADVAYESFAQAAIAALEEHRLAAREALIDARLATGRHAELIPELEALIESHPYREGLRGQLLLALHRAGRQADALEAYRQVRQTLVAELGAEPCLELRTLHGRILNQDPALAVAPLPVRLPETLTWLPGERRTVTVLSVDLTLTDDDSDPEAGQTKAAESLALVTEALRSNGARIEVPVGSGVMGWFGLPLAHDDDPLRAVVAAHQARERVLALAGPPREFRAGVEAGEVVSGVTGAREASGPAVSLASRLQQAARPGEVLIGPQAMMLVRGAAVVERVREPGAPAAWRLLHVDAGARLIPRHLRAQMVGREDEVTRLRTAFGRVARRRTPQRMTVLGEAGIGKTRLARAFAESIDGRVRTVTAACPDGGTGRVPGLLHDLLVQAGGGVGWERVAGLLDDVAPGLGGRLADALGAGQPQGLPHELFADLRRALEILSAVQPLVMIVDDLHWAEAALFELCEYLTDTLSGPVFLIFLARPELVELRPDWSVGGERADLVYLDPLDADAIGQVVRTQASLELPAAVEERIIETAQGNPLFAEQLLAAFEHAETDTIPASLRGLLATRIDRLGPGERDVLRAAAVTGDQLSLEALQVLAPDEARPFLPGNIESLIRKRLLRRTGQGRRVEFPHGLIRDAAYRTLTRRDRERLHLAFADWLEESVGPLGDELDAVVGHHLEQAVVNRRLVGLGPDGVLEARAGTKLASAGTRAYLRTDLTAASDLLARSLDLLPEGHLLVPATTQRLAEVSLPLGDHARAQELLLALSTMPDVGPIDRWLARLEHARSLSITGPQGVTADDLAAIARGACDFFAEAGHDNGLAQALFLLGWLERRRGDPLAAASFGRRSLEVARRCGAVREQLAAAFLVARSLVDGPAPVPDCIAEIESLLRQHAAANPVTMGTLAHARAMAGELEPARELLDHARSLVIERMRVPRLLAFLDWASADVEALAGDVLAAVGGYRAALQPFRRGEEAEHVGETSSRLALVLAGQGQREEARSLADEARAVAPADCVAVRARALTAVARCLAPDQVGAALAMTTTAVDLTPASMPNLKADLLVQRSRVETAARLTQDARSSMDWATRLFESKGNVAALRRLRP
jgi:DNA-binding SARP family transcriptional activator